MLRLMNWAFHATRSCWTCCVIPVHIHYTRDVVEDGTRGSLLRYFAKLIVWKVEKSRQITIPSRICSFVHLEIGILYASTKSYIFCLPLAVEHDCFKFQVDFAPTFLLLCPGSSSLTCTTWKRNCLHCGKDHGGVRSFLGQQEACGILSLLGARVIPSRY